MCIKICFFLFIITGGLYLAIHQDQVCREFIGTTPFGDSWKDGLDYKLYLYNKSNKTLAFIDDLGMEEFFQWRDYKNTLKEKNPLKRWWKIYITYKPVNLGYPEVPRWNKETWKPHKPLKILSLKECIKIIIGRRYFVKNMK